MCLLHPTSCSETSDLGPDVDPQDVLSPASSSTSETDPIDGEPLEPEEIPFAKNEEPCTLTLDDLAAEVDKYARERDEEVSMSQEPREPIKGEEKIAMALKEVIDSKEFPLKGPAQHQFRYWLNQHPDDKAAYSQLKGEKGGVTTTEKKRQFRLKWAAMMHQSVTKETCQRLESWEQVNEELGVYMPIARILKMDGGKTRR